MHIPPKKTQEQVLRERDILRGGFETPFWTILKASIEAEMESRYRLLPSITDLDQLRKIQGEILAFSQILGFEVPYKKATNGM
jgi:hypothetical protein